MPVVDFYVTCATVIPVLFLAVAVEGDTFKSFIRQPLAERTSQGFVATMIRYWSFSAKFNFAQYILVAGVFGEFLALFALFQGSEFYGQRLTVFVATVLLGVAVAIVPIRPCSGRTSRARNTQTGRGRARVQPPAGRRSRRPGLHAVEILKDVGLAEPLDNLVVQPARVARTITAAITDENGGHRFNFRSAAC